MYTYAGAQKDLQGDQREDEEERRGQPAGGGLHAAFRSDFAYCEPRHPAVAVPQDTYMCRYIDTLARNHVHTSTGVHQNVQKHQRRCIAFVHEFMHIQRQMKRK